MLFKRPKVTPDTKRLVGVDCNRSLMNLLSNNFIKYSNEKLKLKIISYGAFNSF